MPWWILKAAVQGTLCRLPQSQRWNQWFQHHFTGSLELTERYFLDKWRQCELHLSTMASHGHHTSVIMELGTGWFQITPVGFALRGAKHVYSVDRQSLVDHKRIADTLIMYNKLIAAGSVGGVSAAMIEKLRSVISRLPLLTAAQALAELNIEIMVTDARSIQLPTGSIDMFASNNTLEHIPGDIILDIFREFARLASPTALMSHYIDLSDHYSHFDKRLGPLHFLRFSESQWKWLNNDLHYQNRLRVNDFRDIHRRAQWSVLTEKNEAESDDAVRAQPLAPQYRQADPKELAVYRSWMVSKRA
jgi:hypothetical protein